MNNAKWEFGREVDKAFTELFGIYSNNLVFWLNLKSITF